MGIRYDEDTGQRYYYDDESGSITPVFQYEDSYVPYSQIPEYERMRMEGWMPGGFYDPATADWKNITGGGGIKFPSEQAYLEYLYGPGVEYKTGADGQKYYKAPGDILPGRTPYYYNPPDSAMTRMMPMLIASMAFPGLAAGLGGGALGAAGAGALLGGTTSAVSGGDFLKGALSGAIGGGLTSGLSGVSSYLQSAEGLGLSKAVADAAVSAGARAIYAGATGGDVDQAILGSLVSSGVGGVASNYVPLDIAKAIAPVVSTALLGGNVEDQIFKSGLSYLKGIAGKTGETAADIEDRERGKTLTDSARTNVAELPESYWNMVASGPSDTMTDADWDKRLGVYGSPIYAGIPGSESINLPEGARLATSDEVSQLIESGVGATILPDGTYAFIVPETITQIDESVPGGGYGASSTGGYGVEDIPEQVWTPGYDLPGGGDLPGFEWTPGYDLPGGGDLQQQFWTPGYDLPGGGDIPEQVWTPGYDLPGGGDIFAPSWTPGYDLPGGGDLPEPGWTPGYDLPGGGDTPINYGGIKPVSGTTTKPSVIRPTNAPAQTGNINYGALGKDIQNIFNTQEPSYPSPIKPFLAPTMLGSSSGGGESIPDYSKIIGALASLTGKGMKEGGSTHVPGPEGKLYEKHDIRGFAVGGPGTGQSDDIPTMLSDGEFVIPADVVSHLGDGSSKAGAEALYKMMEEIRKRDRSTPSDKLPPKAKNPLAYLKAAQKAKG